MFPRPRPLNDCHAAVRPTQIRTVFADAFVVPTTLEAALVPRLGAIGCAFASFALDPDVSVLTFSVASHAGMLKARQRTMPRIAA